ncbi:hypothetical protein N2599_08445 [Rhizobium sullae]|uniref:Uncharacterized protein n=1 Tax=Rhizobium sullae TaxID=50338 RepID=A0ABY5XN15_RHISU|nr:hypothetical protein [Rhizobium sullae]UWU16010.1 hypothetical protein N2599_08445 [Rhizobium sullae]
MFNIIAVYKHEKKVKVMGHTSDLWQLAVAEVFFPSLRLTMRNVRLVQNRKTKRPLVALPSLQRGGLSTLQIGDKAVLEEMARQIAEALPDAPEYEEADAENTGEIIAVFPDGSEVRK